MRVQKTSGALYRVAKYLGDYQALRGGSARKIERRVVRRAVGKVAGRKVMRRL